MFPVPPACLGMTTSVLSLSTTEDDATLAGNSLGCHCRRSDGADHGVVEDSGGRGARSHVAVAAGDRERDRKEPLC